MQELFLTYPLAAWSVVGVLLAAVVIATLWDQVKWWWLNTWYSFPLVGATARLSKDVNRDPLEPEWFKAEKALCRDYKRFIRVGDEQDFLEKVTYIRKAGDTGRRPMPSWIWLLTVVLVVVEALGFSYVFAGYAIINGSENVQRWGALGIALLVSVILVALTHFAGHELFVGQQIRRARRLWNESGQKHHLFTGEVHLAERQSVDDAAPHYTQLCNRVGTQPGRWITISTLIFVVAIAGFATLVRIAEFGRMQHDEVTGQNTQPAPAIPDVLDLTKSASLPPTDAQLDQSVIEKSKSEREAFLSQASSGTIAALAFVFVFLQVLGVLFGYRWGFAGKQSREALRAIGDGRFATYADVREKYLEIADAAQAKLEALQQRMMVRIGEGGTVSGQKSRRTFYDFMEEERSRQSRDVASEREHGASVQRALRPAITSSPAAAVASAPAGLGLEPKLETALAQLDTLGSSADKKQYIASLPEGLQADLIAALKARKDDAAKRAAQAQRDADLDNLLA